MIGLTFKRVFGLLTGKPVEKTFYRLRSERGHPMEKKRVIEALAWNLIQNRYRKGLTQKEVALQVGIPQSTLADAETGLANPSVYQIFQLAEFYQVTVDELLKERPSPFVMGKREDLGRRKLASGTEVREIKSVDQNVHYKEIEIPRKGRIRIPAGPVGAKELLVCHEGSVWIQSANDCQFVKQGQTLELAAHLSKRIFGDEKQAVRFTLVRVNP